MAEAAKILGTDSLIEECIEGCAELQRFHPESLNTIRVVTVRGRSGIRVLGSFIRFGRGGAVVDNAHAGGLFAHVDITEGRLRCLKHGWRAVLSPSRHRAGDKGHPHTAVGLHHRTLRQRARPLRQLRRWLGRDREQQRGGGVHRGEPRPGRRFDAGCIEERNKEGFHTGSQRLQEQIEIIHKRKCQAE